MAYVTLEQIRASGVDEDRASDAVLTPLITASTQLIDRITRQWFEPRSGRLRLDGTDTDTLFLPIPIIEITNLYINSDRIPFDSRQYRAYGIASEDDLMDHRTNPKIVLGTAGGDFFTGLVSSSYRFTRGRQNQAVEGIFGYVEPDRSTPALIRRAAMLLIMEWLNNQPSADTTTTVGGTTGPVPTGSVIIEEETDGHRIKYGGVAATSASSPTSTKGLTALIRNAEVRQILSLYRAPIAIATQANWSNIRVG
jgi:hypothetical protein